MPWLNLRRLALTPSKLFITSGRPFLCLLGMISGGPETLVDGGAMEAPALAPP